MRARNWIFVLVGEILIGFASLLFAVTRDPDGWNALSMRQVAVRSILLGGSVGASLGLLVAARASGTRPTQLILLGAVGGLLAGLAYAVMALEDACEPSFIDRGPCGWVFLGRLFRRPWMPIALWTMFGGMLGGMFAWIAARLTEEKWAAPRASESAQRITQRWWLLIGVVVLVAGFGVLRRQPAVQPGVDAAQRG